MWNNIRNQCLTSNKWNDFEVNILHPVGEQGSDTNNNTNFTSSMWTTLEINAWHPTVENKQKTEHHLGIQHFTNAWSQGHPLCEQLKKQKCGIQCVKLFGTPSMLNHVLNTFQECLTNLENVSTRSTTVSNKSQNYFNTRFKIPLVRARCWDNLI